MYTSTVFARKLGVTTQTLYNWEKAGYLLPFRIGIRRDRRYSETQLLRLLEQKNEQGISRGL